MAAQAVGTDPPFAAVRQSPYLIQQAFPLTRTPRHDFDLLAVSEIVGQRLTIGIREWHGSLSAMFGPMDEGPPADAKDRSVSCPSRRRL